MNAAAQSYGLEGARPGGMGGAYAAISDDAQGIFYNPAGLVHSPQRLLLSFGVQSLFSAGLPLQNDFSNEGALVASHAGVVYNRLTRPNQTLPVLVLGSPALPENYLAERELAPTTNVFSFGAIGGVLRTGLLDQFLLAAFFSKGFFPRMDVRAATNHLPHRLAVSVTGKLTGLQYDGDLLDKAQVNSQDELIALRDYFAEHGHSRFSAGLDVGVMAMIHPRAQVAFTCSNLLRPNLALEGKAWAPRRLRLGLALALHQRRQWLLACDAERDETLQQWRFYLGTETVLPQIAPEIFRLRLGLNHNWFAAGFKLARPSWVELDYAFMFPSFFQHGRPEGFFNHRFSLSFSQPASAQRPGK